MSEIARIRPAEDTDERGTLTGLLDFLRATVERKLAGLTDEQASARPVQPSALTPGGIVKHLTAVERFWFAIDFAALDVEWPWTEEDPHGCFPRDHRRVIARRASALGRHDLHPALRTGPPDRGNSPPPRPPRPTPRVHRRGRRRVKPWQGGDLRA